MKSIVGTYVHTSGFSIFQQWRQPILLHCLQRCWALSKQLSIGAVGLLLLTLCAHGATYRYASSANRIYIEAGGSATLTAIKAALPNAPLELVNTNGKVWLLRANLVVADGSTLMLHGSGAGGDVNELRLLSNNSTATNSVVSVDADWGTLDLNSTRVTSWNEAIAGPDTEYLTYKRAFLRARSRKVGLITQESTLNVLNSDIGYLGFNDTEGYGLTWQVVSSVDGVRVFGNVSTSLIHNCQLGVSSWSADNVNWAGNEVAFNRLYDFDSTDAGHQAALTSNNVHDNDYRASLRYAGSSNRIYVEGRGSVTLTEIKAALPNAPLQLVDANTKVWLLMANLFVTDGCTLMLHGAAAGGDVNDLRLLSNNSSATNSVVSVEADWGTLDLHSTRVTSWNQAAGSPDTEYQTYQRSFLRARSRKVGLVPHESTLNVVNSDIGYLGSNDSESYGLTWDVVNSTAGVRVFGNVSNSLIHHCQLGVRTWSADNVSWTGNEIAFNRLYDFDPADASHQSVLSNNNVHDNDYRASFRYASSSNRIYVEKGGSATLTDIKSALPNAPLQLVDANNKIWLLMANLFVTDDCILHLRGSSAGGDVNELRLLSNNSDVTNSVVSVEADCGTLNLNSTRLTSWDVAVNGPDTEFLTYGRAFIRARSRLVAPVNQESTLNVVNSDIGYLGSNDSDGHALVWKVVGSAAGVHVFGSVNGSHIHHCQLGVSTWSADDVTWTGNEIAFNRLYDFEATDAGHQAVLASNNVHDNDFPATYRWSTSSQRLYVTGPGSGTLTEMKTALPTAPLVLVNPASKIWYVGADMIVENGAQLQLYGPAIGGDVAEVRLKSDNTTASNAIVDLRADWGWLDIRNTKITSWDNAANGPDTETDTYGRAYIRARSTMDADGVTPRQSRMDVIDSDIGYLGSPDTEAYGLVWKVVPNGVTNLPPGLTIFDLVQVYGDIVNSRLHHNYFGAYTFGHYGGRWADNEVDHNVGYGLDPHDDSDYLLIEDNNVHHNGLDGIIASARCDHGILRSNTCWANAKSGIMLHRSSDDWLVEGNRSHQNGDSGIAIFASSRAMIRNNLCLSNRNAGIRLSVGAADNVVSNNQFGYCGTNALMIYQDNDPPNAGDDGRPKRNLIANNHFYEYGSDALKLEYGHSITLIGNVFSSSVPTALRFHSATNILAASNSLPTNVLVKLSGSAAVPNLTTFKGQPRIILQLDAYSTAGFKDDGGAIFDFGQNQLFTSVNSMGSAATVTRTNLGGTTAILTRNLFANLDAGTVRVVPVSWSTTGYQSKLWTAQTAVGTPLVAYTIGDLTPGSTYVAAVGIPVVPIGTFIASPQGRFTFRFTNSTPSVSTTNTFTVVVDKENTPPVLPTQANRTINELTSLTVTNRATDSDVPPATLTYALTAINIANNELVSNASISANGVITWTPAEAQGPSTHRFTTVASDGYLTATNSFMVVVNEVNNSAPVLPAQADRTIAAMQTLNVANTATDTDIPSMLTYTLVATRLPGNSAVTDASISANGVITWTPATGQTPSTNLFTTSVSDGTFSATNRFTVNVETAVIPVSLSVTLTPTNTALLRWPAPSSGWTLHQKGTLQNANWVVTTNPVNVVGGQNEVIVSPATGTRFFRLIHP